MGKVKFDPSSFDVDYSKAHELVLRAEIESPIKLGSYGIKPINVDPSQRFFSVNVFRWIVRWGRLVPSACVVRVRALTIYYEQVINEARRVRDELERGEYRGKKLITLSQRLDKKLKPSAPLCLRKGQAYGHGRTPRR